MTRLFCFLSLAIGLSFFTSCGENNLTTEELLIQEIATASNKVAVSSEDLIDPIKFDVNANHFETYIDQAYSVEAKGFEVKLGTEKAIYFDTDGIKLECNKDRKKRKGDWHKGDHDGKCGGMDFDLIEIETIPQAATDYVTANHPDASIMRAKAYYEDDAILKIFVGLDNKKIVVFDAAGSFLGYHELIMYPCGENKEELDINQLDAAITEYISTNYSSAIIKAAFQIDHKEVGEHIIVALLMNDNKVVLAFDLEGNFIKELHK